MQGEPRDAAIKARAPICERKKESFRTVQPHIFPSPIAHIYNILIKLELKISQLEKCASVD